MYLILISIIFLGKYPSGYLCIGKMKETLFLRHNSNHCNITSLGLNELEKKFSFTYFWRILWSFAPNPTNFSNHTCLHTVTRNNLFRWDWYSDRPYLEDLFPLLFSVKIKSMLIKFSYWKINIFLKSCILCTHFDWKVFDHSIQQSNPSHRHFSLDHRALLRRTRTIFVRRLSRNDIGFLFFRHFGLSTFKFSPEKKQAKIINSAKLTFFFLINYMNFRSDIQKSVLF